MKLEDLLVPPRLISIETGTAAPAGRPVDGPQPLPGVTIGQLLQARILGQTSAGEILLEINGERLAAESQVVLPEKGTVWLEVRQTNPVLLLAPAAGKGNAQELLKLFLSGSAVISEAVREVAATPEEPRFAALRAFFDQTGIEDSEPLIRLGRLLGGLEGGTGTPAGRGLGETIKELATILMQEGAGSERRAQHSVGQGVEKLAHFVEASQTINAQPPSQTPPFFHIFPCWLAGTEGWGAWSFAGEEDRKEGESAAYSLSFFLFLTHLGDLHLAVRIRDQALDGTFSLSSETARTFIEEHLPELTASLAGLGFASIRLGCQQLRQKLPALFAAQLFGQLGAGPSLIDVKA